MMLKKPNGVIITKSVFSSKLENMNMDQNCDCDRCENHALKIRYTVKTEALHTHPQPNT